MTRYAAILTLVLAASAAAGPVTLTRTDDGIRLENDRVKLRISPQRGGAVTRYVDKLLGKEMVLQKKWQGLCMDHFQEQPWPGELLEVPYESKILRQTAEEVQIQVRRTASGIWKTQKTPHPKIAGLVVEKVYTLRADSPTLVCDVNVIAPKGQARVFSYWLQNVVWAGGDYDAADDRTFRPSARGVRSSAKDKNSHYGREDWLRDFTAGWMALLDVPKKSGLAMCCDYDELNVVYACNGNATNEFMFRTTFLPGGRKRTYHVELVPIHGLPNVWHVDPDMVVGATVTTDNKGAGRLQLVVERSRRPVKDVAFTVRVVSATDPDKGTDAGQLAFGPLTDRAQTKGLALSGIPRDPVVVRIAAVGHRADGSTLKTTFENFVPGAYKWADNIQTDMSSPVYAAPRPVQKLSLERPAKMKVSRHGKAHYLFFQGLHDERYRVADAMHAVDFRLLPKVINYSWSGSWKGKLTDFPYDYGELLQYKTILLGGISATGLRPVGVAMLHDYLVAGGGMVVLGSHGGYGRSRLAGTDLAKAWPVTFEDNPFSLVPTGGAPIVRGPDHDVWMDGVEPAKGLRCYYIHPAKPKPGAKVVLTCGGRPFVVTGTYGPNDGRVACVLGSPLGSPGTGQTPFWDDPHWYLFLRNLMWWTSHSYRRFEL